jgi:hypothetical protein
MPVQDLKIGIQLQNLHKYGSSFLKPTKSDDQWNRAKYKWTKQLSSFWQSIIISIPLQCRLEQHCQGGSWPTSRRFWGMNRSHKKKKLKWRMKPTNFGYFRWLTLLEPKKTEHSLKFAVFVNPTWVRHGVLMILMPFRYFYDHVWGWAMDWGNQIHLNNPWNIWSQIWSQ